MSDSRPDAIDRCHETVVCLGSSPTASKGTYKWIDELENRPHNKRFRFVNLGVGGDLSFNTVRLLDRVIAVQPDRVIVLIGTNDIMASVFPNFRRFVQVWKRLPEEPSPAGFEENLYFIVRKLPRGANSRIGLSSLAPLGEDPHSPNPVQARLNDLITTYNDIIANVASNEHADYIPFWRGFPGPTGARRDGQTVYPVLVRILLSRLPVSGNDSAPKLRPDLSNQRLAVSRRRHSSQHPGWANPQWMPFSSSWTPEKSMGSGVRRCIAPPCSA